MKEPFSDPKLKGASLTNESRAAAHAHIQEMIPEHERILQYYKGYHNALTFTCRLPPEVLVNIFSEGLSHEVQKDKFVGLGRVQFLRTISRICSHWRNVALSAPGLWALIPITNALWTEAAIQRSQQALLTIFHTVPIDREKNTIFREVLASHSHRINQLSISGGYFGASELLASLKWPIPMLERLEIRFLSTGAGIIKFQDEFLASLSRLRHLALEDCMVTWNLLCLRNLRSLRLSGICFHNDRPLVPEIVKILLDMPLLESLEVLGIPRSDDSPLKLQLPYTPIRLQHLAHVNVSGAVYECVLFLQRIDYSQNSKSLVITIFLPSRNYGDDSLLSCYQTLAQKLNNTLPLPIQKVRIADGAHFFSAGEASTLTIVESGTAAPASDLSSRMTISVKLYKTALPREARTAFLEALCSDQLSFLDVNRPVTPAVWLPFSTLSSLTHIRADSTGFQLMQVLQRGLTAAASQPPSFPALKKLTVIGWSLSQAGKKPKTRLKLVMMKTLTLRKNAGVPLETLELENCSNFTLADVVSLRTVVENVNCYAIIPGNE